MEMLRIPIKFGKAVSRLSIEEKGYIFSSLFAMGNGENIEIRDDSAGDLLSLIYLECEKMENWANIGKQQGHHGVKGGRPKITPLGLENVTPRGNPKVKESNSKVKEIKEKDNTNTVILDYHKNPEKRETFVWQWLDYCFQLGYSPAKDETIEGISDFLTKTFLENGIDIDKNGGHDSGKSAMHRWFTYWKESGEKIKNFKSKFSNTIQYSIKK